MILTILQVIEGICTLLIGPGAEVFLLNHPAAYAILRVGNLAAERIFGVILMLSGHVLILKFHPVELSGSHRNEEGLECSIDRCTWQRQLS